MPKITFDLIISKAKEYKFQIIFLIIICILAGLAKTICNFILDWRVVLILFGILWYLGYLTNIQNKVTKQLKKINYIKNI